jgi:N-acetylmuramoyl-L-alanine amidase
LQFGIQRFDPALWARKLLLSLLSVRHLSLYIPAVALVLIAGLFVAEPFSRPGSAFAQSPQAVTVVLDPAHGGADTGARGPSGANEKDLVLSLARAVRAQLAQHGYRVVMTRDGDTSPSFDDRAAVANAIPEAIFISLHVSSTGAAGTVRTYYYQFAAPFSYSPAAPGSPAAVAFPTPAPASALPGLPLWREAQRPFGDASRSLAGILQTTFAQQFSNSPSSSSAVPIRELRSVAAPAVAVEVSSVAVPNPATIAAMASPLSAAIAKGVAEYRPASPPATPPPPAPASGIGAPGAPGDAH